MSRTIQVLAGLTLFGAAWAAGGTASAMPMGHVDGIQNAPIEQARTICNYDRWGRRFCYNTSGRPLYQPRPRRYYGPPRYMPAPAPYYRY